MQRNLDHYRNRGSLQLQFKLNENSECLNSRVDSESSNNGSVFSEISLTEKNDTVKYCTNTSNTYKSAKSIKFEDDQRSDQKEEIKEDPKEFQKKFQRKDLYSSTFKSDIRRSVIFQNSQYQSSGRISIQPSFPSNLSRKSGKPRETKNNNNCTNNTALIRTNITRKSILSRKSIGNKKIYNNPTSIYFSNGKNLKFFLPF